MCISCSSYIKVKLILFLNFGSHSQRGGFTLAIVQIWSIWHWDSWTGKTELSLYSHFKEINNIINFCLCKGLILEGAEFIIPTL